MEVSADNLHTTVVSFWKCLDVPEYTIGWYSI